MGEGEGETSHTCVLIPGVTEEPVASGQGPHSTTFPQEEADHVAAVLQLS